MRPSRLQNPVELPPLRRITPRQRIEHGIQPLQRQQRPQPHRRREHIVRRLPIVHMVIRMHPLVPPQRRRFVGALRARDDLVRPIRNHLIRVHVEADARAGLKDIDDKLRVPPPVDHLLRRRHNRIRPLRAHHAQLAVGLRRRALHHPRRANQRRMRAHAADRVVLHRPRRLRAIHRPGRDLDRPERVLLCPSLVRSITSGSHAHG